MLRNIVLVVLTVIAVVGIVVFFGLSRVTDKDSTDIALRFYTEPVFLDEASHNILLPSPDIINQQASFLVYTRDREPTGGVAIQLQYTEDGGYPMLNVAIDFNNNGTYEAYDSPSGRQEEWILQNVPAYVRESKMTSFEIPIVDTRIYGKEYLFGHATFSDAPLINTWLGQTRDVAREMRFTVKTHEFDDTLGFNVPGNGIDVYRGVPDFIRTNAWNVTWHAVTREAVDIDLGFRVPDIEQPPLSCAPTVATNALQGLANVYSVTDLMPTASIMLDELKKDLLFGDAGRAGVLKQNFIPGTYAFMRRHSLPVDATVIENPTLEDIENAMRNRGIVTMALEFIDEVTDTIPIPVASHLVTVTGLSIRDGVAVIRGHDPLTPSGVESWYWNPAVDGQTNASLFYPRWSGGPTRVSRIYIYKVIDIEAAIASGLLPPGAEGRRYPIEMLRIATGYYPVSQFTISDEPTCEEPFYSGPKLPIGFAEKETRDLTVLGDGYLRACGFGKVSEVPVETVSITWEQLQVYASASRAED